ncbi:MAG: SDR family NAD(P)-dependent oxidoreductase [Parvularculaceae bacterium]
MTNSNPVRFDGKVALVTGAGSGIGACTARELGRRGAHVIVNDPADDGRAETVAAQIIQSGGKAAASLTPVGDFKAAKEIIDFAQTTFGPVDILVNNAGIARPGPFWTRTDDEILTVLRVNLHAPYALMRAVWPGMAEKKSGRIVNLCSSAAFGSGISGAYAASKAGLIGLTKDAAIASEPHGVFVNGVMPCAYTPLLDNHPDKDFCEWMKKFMPAEFVAKVICWLASDRVTSGGNIYSAAGGQFSKIAFLESKGVFDPAFELEDIADIAADASDFSGAAPIDNQAAHEKIIADFFPAPGAK